jgi:diacylglycerol kinase
MQVQQSETEVVLVPEVEETTAEVPSAKAPLRTRIGSSIAQLWHNCRTKAWELTPSKAKEHLSKLPIVWNGHLINWRESPSYRLHWYADGLAFFLGAIFLVSRNDWFWLFLACALKAGAEALNTSHEKHADYVWPRRAIGSNRTQSNRTAKDIKDSAAFAVGITVVFSLSVWAMIFVPEVWRLVT